MAGLLKKLSCLLLALFLFLACSRDDENSPETVGSIVVETATRGAIQYLIQVENQRYWPENLPQEFKHPDNHNLEIILRFIQKGEEKEIFLPSPNDVPVFAYSVPVIHILDIKARQTSLFDYFFFHSRV